MPRELIERRIPWPRNRHWRPGEPMTVSERGRTATYRLRGVMRDTDPRSEFAIVTLELVRAIADGDRVEPGEELSATG